MDADRSPISLLGQRLPAPFERRVLVLAPGQAWHYDELEWRGALVVVEHGLIELECLNGSRYCFRHGSMLWLEHLPLRALHNPGRAQAVLVAVVRRAAGAGH